MPKTIIVLLITVSALFATSHKGFNIKNLKKLPIWERYEFRAKGTTLAESPVIIEYEVLNYGTENAMWDIHGSMTLNGAQIVENYKVRLRDLNVISYTRTLNFERGSHTMKGELSLDNKGEKDEFIVGTIQAMLYLLRTFPLDNKDEKIYVRTAQQRRKKLNLKVRNKGIEKIETKTLGKVEAIEVELSLSVPVIGAFLPDVSCFFLPDDVHTLAAIKGSFSMSGKKLDVFLVDYKSRYRE